MLEHLRVAVKCKNRRIHIHLHVPHAKEYGTGKNLISIVRVLSFYFWIVNVKTRLTYIVIVNKVMCFYISVYSELSGSDDYSIKSIKFYFWSRE